MNDKDQNQDVSVHRSSVPDWVWLVVGLVLLAITFALSLYFLNLNKNASFILNILVSFGAAAATQGLSGFANLAMPVFGGKLRAGGSLVVLFVVLFTGPFEESYPPLDSSQPPLEKQCLYIDKLTVEPETFHSLQEFTETAVLTLSGENTCGRKELAGLYMRFGDAVDNRDNTMRANPLKQNCIDRRFDRSCWQNQNPVPLSAKEGEWSIKIKAPSFDSFSEVSGDVTLTWEARDYSKPEKDPPLGKSSITIRIQADI